MTLANPSESQRLGTFFWIAICFLISGFAALLYETVWLRQFAILFGTSDQALGIVLASYMGGLAFGSWVASRKVQQITRPLLVYGLLELLIAVSALLVPLGILIARRLQEHFLGGMTEPPDAGTISQNAFNLLTTLGLILVPTALMGATLPLLARQVVRSDRELGPRVGLLYAINTAGAVLGTLVAAFVLMPTVGMRATTWVGALCNAAVFGVVLLLVRQGVLNAPVSTPAAAPDPLTQSAQGSTKLKQRTNRGKGNRNANVRNTKYRGNSEAVVASKRNTLASAKNILWLVGIGGAIAFCCEILFTRMLGHFLGGSVYAFSTMLAGFLLGIAIGGAIASRFAIDRVTAAVGYVYAQVCVSLFTIFSYRFLDYAIGWRWWAENAAGAGPAQVTLAIGTLLPMSIGVGLAFPFAIRVLASDESEAATASAQVYSVSTLGGIIGALGTGAWLLPSLAYQGVCTVAIIGSLCSAAAAIGLLKVRPMHAIAIAVAIGVFLAARPSFPVNVTRVSPIHFQPEFGQIVFNEVGKSASVSVMDQPAGLKFITNGLPESFVRKPGGPPHSSDSWLVGLPVAIRPGADSMMLIGLGGGSAAADIPPSIRHVDVVELSQAVVRANQATAGMRNRVALDDPRIKLVINDARSALRLSSKQYDVIVSQPSHPWTAGASHLYTREFAELAHSRLRGDGVFLQWVGEQFLDAELVRNVAATLSDVFLHVRLYQPVEGSLLWVASDRPMQPEKKSPLEMSAEDVDYFYSLGLSCPTDLLSFLSADEAGVKKLAASSDPILDERNLLAMRAPRLIHRPASGETTSELAAVHPMRSGISYLQSLCPAIDLPYYLQLTQGAQDGKLVEQFGIPLLADEQQSALAVAELERSRSGKAAWVKLLSQQRNTKHPDTSFHVLHVDVAGELEPKLTDTELDHLRIILSQKYRSLLEVMAASRRNDIQLAEQQDDLLASFEPADAGFRQAFLLRLLWRIKQSAPTRAQRSIEVIELTDRYAAYIHIEKWGYYRTLAGIFAGRDDVALFAIAEMLNLLETQLSVPGGSPSVDLVAAISKVAPLLENDQYFPKTPRDKLGQLREYLNNLGKHASYDSVR